MLENLKTQWGTWAGKEFFAPAVILAVSFVVFVGSSYIIGKISGGGFIAGTESAWRIAVALGGIFALGLATRRTQAAGKQADAALGSSLSQRYEKASEMIWNPGHSGIRESGCHALKSLGRHDVDMAMQCRDLLISFIRRSFQDPEQEKAEPEAKCELDILAADRALSYLCKKWSKAGEFRDSPLKDLPKQFWRKTIPRRDYRGVNLSEANLSGAYFNEADLREADLSGAKFSEADLSGAKFSGADLSKADFSKADLDENADFHGANLYRANLSGASLHVAKFSETDLREANLSKVDLRWADLRGANLNEANLSEANLSKANLGEANLSKANLREADLHKANLSKADLRWVDLRRADLSGARFSEADLRGANLSKADFSEDGSAGQAAKNLTERKILSAVWSRSIGPPQLPRCLEVDVNKMGEPPSGS